MQPKVTPKIYQMCFTHHSLHHCLELLAILRSQQIESRIVGGFVRDQVYSTLFPDACEKSNHNLSSKHDIDIAAASTPEKVEEALKAYNIPTIAIGKAHGTICAIYKGEKYEITSLRSDIECDGRHATVNFGASFALDAQRRDFTINAMSYCPFHLRIYDYFGGMEDLENKRVVFVGDAMVRVEQDYLRILRFIRFSLRFAASFHADGARACQSLFHKLQLISKERVKRELDAVLAQPQLEYFIEDIEQIFSGSHHDVKLGILQAGILDFRSLKQYCEYSKILTIEPSAIDINNYFQLATIYCALLSQYFLQKEWVQREGRHGAYVIYEICEFNEWKFNKQQAKQIIKLISSYIYLQQFAHYDAQRRLTIIINYIWYKYYPHHIYALCYTLALCSAQVSSANNGGVQDAEWLRYIRNEQTLLLSVAHIKNNLPPPKCPYNARQLIDAGVARKDIRKTLAQLEEEWIVNGFE
ncbi:putative CCA-adding enzyme/Poly(A) polymerase [Rickettsiales endosymbiont of Paramecium tredecaurelia]|uniref:CCA tRNA nucleotidyltransferase n=1 Tax=Candidatus Sarmatiella mevalonica TaxID=2770581 RepID=UPI0019211F2C|nr:CCA tRNA nucleotidyltransferase [Candidatus Sarmatiella mevalonica]MBL3284560.1 putative CCA-adding enzyme/Poly(A) polymerase [Candidatus Sarmatiella mevalonica]